MIPAVEYAIVALFLVAFAVLCALVLLGQLHKPVITWSVIKIGNNATVTVRSSSKITLCKVASGHGKCSIVRDSLCVCQVADRAVVKVCSCGTCKLIVIK